MVSAKIILFGGIRRQIELFKAIGQILKEKMVYFVMAFHTTTTIQLSRCEQVLTERYFRKPRTSLEALISFVLDILIKKKYILTTKIPC